MQKLYQPLNDFDSFENYAKGNLTFFKKAFLPQFIPSKGLKYLWPGEMLENIIDELKKCSLIILYIEYVSLYEELTQTNFK